MSGYKPRLRMIHNMARSGGTLISKCLGCMEGVVLLSEIHPAAWRMFNPLKQAVEWHKLLNTSDLLEINSRKLINFADAINLIARRTNQRGDVLLIRDWSHLDYTGYPYVTEPSYRPVLYEELAERFDILRVAIVRDPVDQWLSLRQLAIMQTSIQTGDFNLGKFLAGYLEFARLSVKTGYIRYEDFLLEPDAIMRDLCGRLDIPFDPGFINKWPTYTKISGDVLVSRGNVGNEIKPLPRRPVEAELREAFLANEDYQEAIRLLGYETI